MDPSLVAILGFIAFIVLAVAWAVAIEKGKTRDAVQTLTDFLLAEEKYYQKHGHYSANLEMDLLITSYILRIKQISKEKDKLVFYAYLSGPIQLENNKVTFLRSTGFKEKVLASLPKDSQLKIA